MLKLFNPNVVGTVVIIALCAAKGIEIMQWRQWLGRLCAREWFHIPIPTSLILIISGRPAGTWRILYPAAFWCQAKICASIRARGALAKVMAWAKTCAVGSGWSDNPRSQSAETPSDCAHSATKLAFGSRALVPIRICDGVELSAPVLRDCVSPLRDIAVCKRVLKRAERSRLSTQSFNGD